MIFLLIWSIVAVILWIIALGVRVARVVDYLDRLNIQVTTSSVSDNWDKAEPLWWHWQTETYGVQKFKESSAFPIGLGWPLVILYYIFKGIWWCFIKAVSLRRSR